MAQRPSWHRGPPGTKTPLAQPPCPACGGAGERRSIRARLGAHRPPSQASAPAASTDQGPQAPRQDSQGLCRRGWTPRAAPEASPGAPGWLWAPKPSTTTNAVPPANPDIPVIPQPRAAPSSISDPPQPPSTAPSAMPTPSAHHCQAGQRSPCYPTTASKPGEGQENGIRAAALSKSHREGSPDPPCPQGELLPGIPAPSKQRLGWVQGHSPGRARGLLRAQEQLSPLENSASLLGK